MKVDLNPEAKDGAGELTFEYFIAPEPPAAEENSADDDSDGSSPDGRGCLGGPQCGPPSCLLLGHPPTHIRQNLRNPESYV